MHRSSWFILGSISMLVMQFYVLMQCISPLLYTIIHELEISHSAGGFLYAVPIMMIGVLSFPLGIVSDRIGSHKAILYASLIVIISAFSRALTSNYITLLFATAIFGAGMAFFFPNLSKMVNDYFQKPLVGRATGVYTAAIPFGSGLGIALTKYFLILTGGWRQTLAAWSGITIPFILVCLFLIQKYKKQFLKTDTHTYGESRKSSQSSAVDSGQLGFSEKASCFPIIICGILLALLNYIFFTTIGWLPTYLIEEGWDPISAGTVTSIISFVEAPCILLVPFISHRTGRIKSIFVINFLIIAVSLVAISFKSSLCWAFAPILGFTFGGTFVLLLAFPAQFSMQDVGRAAGAILSIGYIGALLGPFSSGYLRDMMGNFSLVFLVMVGVSLLGCALSFTFPSLKRRFA